MCRYAVPVRRLERHGGPGRPVGVRHARRALATAVRERARLRWALTALLPQDGVRAAAPSPLHARPLPRQRAATASQHAGMFLSYRRISIPFSLDSRPILFDTLDDQWKFCLMSIFIY
jgi:hypothetical protein